VGATIVDLLTYPLMSVRGKVLLPNTAPNQTILYSEGGL
jgi:hypothetical protein